jgi:hypothetical protein
MGRGGTLTPTLSLGGRGRAESVRSWQVDQAFDLAEDGHQIRDRRSDDVALTALMLVVGKRRKVQLLVVPGVVVSENQCPRGVHILINVHQAVYGYLDIHKFAHVEDGTVSEVEFATDEPFVSAALIIRDGGR